MFKSEIATQCSHWAPTWAYLRDNAKPIVPDDVAQLREVREMMPPSKAHVKRLQRQRALVVKAHKVHETGDDHGGGRARLNEARKYGAMVAAAIKGK